MEIWYIGDIWDKNIGYWVPMEHMGSMGHTECMGNMRHRGHTVHGDHMVNMKHRGHIGYI